MEGRRHGTTAFWKQGQPAQLGCVQAVMDIHTEYNNLYETLRIVKRLYPYQVDALRGDVLTGIAMFADQVRSQHHLSTVPEGYLTRIEAKLPTAVMLLAAARQHGYLRRVWQQVAWTLAEGYNGQKQIGVIRQWML